MRIVLTEKFCVIEVSGVDTNSVNDTVCVSQSTIQPRDDFHSNNIVTTSRKLDEKQPMGIFLDIDEPYTRILIERAFQHPSRAPHFRITLGPGVGWDPIPLPPHCQFQWSEYERIDWHNGVLTSRHGASSYCVRKGLSRKAQLAHYTHRHICKYPNSILREAIPETIVLDCWSVWDDESCETKTSCMNHSGGLADVVISNGRMAGNGDCTSINRRKRLDVCLSDAKNAMDAAETTYEASINTERETAAPVWILKGSTTNKGAGIFIVHLYEQVVDHCWSESSVREWVLQRYITNPLLLRKRKFHIRAYVVAVSALRVYLYRNCLALCAGNSYRKDNFSTDLSAHITNTAFQIEANTSFQEQLCVLQWNEETISPILVRDGTFNTIQKADEAIRATIERMGAITGELFRAYKGEFGVFAPLGGCFEHYGLDFLVDDTWNVFLLEVNPGPDFKQTGGKLELLIQNLMGCTIDAALLPMVTGQTIQDIDSLMLVYEENRSRAL